MTQDTRQANNSLIIPADLYQWVSNHAIANNRTLSDELARIIGFAKARDGFIAGGSQDDRDTLGAIERFLDANGSKFNSRHSSGCVEYMIPATQITQLADGYSRNQILGALRMAGMLNKPGNDGNSSVVIRVGEKLVRTYIITMS